MKHEWILLFERKPLSQDYKRISNLLVFCISWKDAIWLRFNWSHGLQLPWSSSIACLKYPVLGCSGVRFGGAGGESAPPKFLICRKSGQNPWKFGTNLRKFGHRCFGTFKWDWMEYVWIWLFFQKVGTRWVKVKTLLCSSCLFLIFMECLAHKIFSGKFGEIGEKFLRTPKNLPAPTPMLDWHSSNFEVFVQPGLSFNRAVNTNSETSYPLNSRTCNCQLSSGPQPGEAQRAKPPLENVSPPWKNVLDIIWTYWT